MFDNFLSNKIANINTDFLNKNEIIEIPVVYVREMNINPLIITRNDKNNLVIKCNYFGLFSYVLAQHLYFKNENLRIPIVIFLMTGLLTDDKDSSCLIRCNDQNGNKVTKMWSLLRYLQHNKLCFILKKHQA